MRASFLGIVCACFLSTPSSFPLEEFITESDELDELAEVATSLLQIAATLAANAEQTVKPKLGAQHRAQTKVLPERPPQRQLKLEPRPRHHFIGRAVHSVLDGFRQIGFHQMGFHLSGEVHHASTTQLPAWVLEAIPWMLVGILLWVLVGLLWCVPPFTQRDNIDRVLVEKVASAKGISESPEVLWLNTLISVLWPKINIYFQNLMVCTVQPAVNNALPHLMRGTISFGEMTLGDAQPRVGPIVVRERGADTIIVDVGINLDLDIVFTIRAGLFASLKVTRIVLSGTVSVVFRPLQSEPPFFGGLEVFFANAPEMDIVFGGLAEAANSPGLRGVVRSALMGTLTQFLVLPSRLAFKVTESEGVSLAELKCPDPLGVLRLTLLGGEDIAPNKNVYVMVKLGQDVWKSPSAEQSRSPVWHEGNMSHLLVYDMTQLCSVLVYDENPGRAFDLIGEAKDVPLDLLGHGCKGSTDVILPLTLEGKSCGRIMFSSTWLTLSDSGLSRHCYLADAQGPQKVVTTSPLTCLGGCCPANVFTPGLHSEKPSIPRSLPPDRADNSIILFASILSIAGLPKDSKKPFTVHLSIGHFETSTRPSYPLRGGLSTGKMKEEICGKLAERGLSAEEIGSVLTLWPEFVENLISAQKEQNQARGQEKLSKWRDSVNKQRAVTDPQWYEIVKLLVPMNAEVSNEPVVLELRDSKGAVLGNRLEVKLEDITKSAGAQLEGPFRFSESIVMDASLRARSLQAA